MKEPQLNVDLKLTTALVCEKCNGEVFAEGVMLRKASKFITGTTQDALIPIPVFSCRACGHVNNDFLPVMFRKGTEAPKLPRTDMHINKDE